LWKLSLPDRFLVAMADAAPETASERGGTVQELRGTPRSPRARAR
jgi:hypothetical protein